MRVPSANLRDSDGLLRPTSERDRLRRSFPVTKRKTGLSQTRTIESGLRCEISSRTSLFEQRLDEEDTTLCRVFLSVCARTIFGIGSVLDQDGGPLRAAKCLARKGVGALRGPRAPSPALRRCTPTPCAQRTQVRAPQTEFSHTTCGLARAVRAFGIVCRQNCAVSQCD